MKIRPCAHLILALLLAFIALPPRSHAQGADETAQSQASPNGRFFISLGTYSDPAHAETLIAQINALGFNANAEIVEYQGRNVQRVRVGPYADRAEAQEVRQKIKQANSRVPAAVVDSIEVAQARSSNPYAAAAQREAEQAIQEGKFPELQELTNSSADQVRAVHICSNYHGDDNRICGEVAGVYAEQARKELIAKMQRDADAERERQQEQELQRREAEAERALTAARQNATDYAGEASNEVASPARAQAQLPTDPTTVQRLTTIRVKQQEAAQLAAQAKAKSVAQKVQQQAIDNAAAEVAAAQEKQQHEANERSDTIFKVFILAFVVSYLALLIGGLNNKFVVFYDKGDFVATAMILVSLIVGTLLSLFFSGGQNEPPTLLQQVFWYAGCLSAAGFAFLAIKLSIQYNRSVPLGLTVGIFKVLTAIFLFLVLVAARPKSKRDSVVGIMNHNRETAIFLVVLAALGWLGTKLINGEQVYEDRGWKPAT